MADLPTIPLPSGKTATLRAGTGRDFVKAGTLAGQDQPMAVGAALISLLVQVDGKALSFDDALDLPLNDFMKLQNIVTGKGVA